MERQEALTAERADVSHQIGITEVASSRFNFGCDKIEELENDLEQISNELDEVGEKIERSKLLPYTLCVSD